MTRKPPLSAYEAWVLNTYGGRTPVEGLLTAATALRVKAGQDRFPIMLSPIAELLGLNPAPLYRPLPCEACLLVQGDQLRIALRQPSGRAPQHDSYKFGRFRFSYAHELVHSMAFDFSLRPPVRIAPMPKGNEEEVICNKVAGGLLLPVDLLHEEIHGRRIDAVTLVSLAAKARVSIQGLVVQFCAHGRILARPGTLFLLSKACKGTFLRGAHKPRCVAGGLVTNRGTLQLPPMKGIESIFVREQSSRRWSLVNYHGDMALGSNVGPVSVRNEIVVFPDGQPYVLNVTHERIHNSPYVWTWGIATPVNPMCPPQ